MNWLTPLIITAVRHITGIIRERRDQQEEKAKRKKEEKKRE